MRLKLENIEKQQALLGVKPKPDVTTTSAPSQAPAKSATPWFPETPPMPPAQSQVHVTTVEDSRPQQAAGDPMSGIQIPEAPLAPTFNIAPVTVSNIGSAHVKTSRFNPRRADVRHVLPWTGAHDDDVALVQVRGGLSSVSTEQSGKHPNGAGAELHVDL